MLFTLIFVSLYVLGWMALGFAPWLALSVYTRGHAGLRYLLLSVFAAVAGGLAVPTLIRDDGLGIVLSFAAAFALPCLLLIARQVARASAAGHPEAK